MRAFRVHSDAKNSGKVVTMNRDELSPGDVVVEVYFSGVNFKDALAGTGTAPILKQYPLNPGIDAAGVVVESKNTKVKVGQKVLLNGEGLGEVRDGGFAEFVRVPAETIVPLPEAMSLRESMVLGTAGFTAALAYYRMLANGQHPSLGPILVTGASGGVGQFATSLLAGQGYEVWGVSGKPGARERLLELGAAKVLQPEELELGSRPLESIRFGGALDNVGGELLGKILPHVQLWGNVVSIGLAGGSQFSSSVMPFILRGVSLLGASSNNTAHSLREEIWQKLSREWRLPNLDNFVYRSVSLEGLPEAFTGLLNRKVQGRILVEVKK